MEQYIVLFNKFPLLWVVGLPVLVLFVLAGAQEMGWRKINSVVLIIFGVAVLMSNIGYYPGDVVSETPVGGKVEAITSVLMGMGLLLGGCLALIYKIWKDRMGKKKGNGR